MGVLAGALASMLSHYLGLFALAKSRWAWW